MTSDVTTDVPAVCRWLLRHVPPIKCITLGGSRARGSASSNSDFDVFVFTEDEPFHEFVRRFPEALADGFGPTLTLRPPTLTRGFGFQFSAFNQALGAVDYFLSAPFVIQPFDRFGHHKIVFEEARYFDKHILAEERNKSVLSTTDLLSHFEFRIFSLYTETKRNILKGEVFQAQQALLELRSYSFGVIKTVICDELFDYSTKARRGEIKASKYYKQLNDCVVQSGMITPAECADEVISIFIEAMNDSEAIADESIQNFTARLRKAVNTEP